MDQLVPWKVWGRYENPATEGEDDHQVAHVDFASIVYEYDRRKRTLEVQAVLDDEPDRVMIKTFEKMPGGKVWNFNFRHEINPATGGEHWVLRHDQNAGASLKDKLPMTQKY